MEYPVREGGGTPPAVDVAWFVDQTQKFPVMIFEVESRSSNAAPYNAMKVLGAPREVFEKPLFFFHLFLGKATESERIKALETQYGLLNYRAYQEGNREFTELVLDVLSQHRRVRNDVNIRKLVPVLATDAWRDAVDVDRVLVHCENLQLRRELLPDYAWLVLNGQERARNHYVRLLRSAYESDKLRNGTGYSGYFGQNWDYPIHLGILATAGAVSGPSLLDSLSSWQHGDGDLTQIGPHYGLSRDNDEFIACAAPAFLCFLAGLFGSVAGGCAYLLSVCSALCPEDSPLTGDLGIFHSLWMVHLAVAAGDEATFRQHLERVREARVPADVVLMPPAAISLDDHEDFGARESAPLIYPDFHKFGEAAAAAAKPHVHRDRLGLALELLQSESAPYDCSALFVWTLHGQR